MSEYIPITTDLRLLVGCFTTKLTDFERDKFNQLCDSIDAIHSALEAENAALKAKLDRVKMEPPKDADGEYICAGDKLDGYGKTIEVVELRYGRSGWVLISRDGNAYADTFAFTHNHVPTVEDVLAEMFAKAIERGELTNGAKRTIAEYAAKLRLAGDAE